MNAKSSGIFCDLNEFVIPKWVESGIGFKITMPLKMEADTKLTHLKVSNMYGGESEIQIHSLDHDDKVETKFKSTRFSYIHLSEADAFQDPKVFDILADQLRVIGLPFEDHKMVLDCNPPEEGPDHWLYKKFFINPNDPEILEKHPEFGVNYKQIQINIDDNPFLDPREAEELKQKYIDHPHRYKRFVLGEWVKDDTSGLFSSVYDSRIHVVGDVESPDKRDHTVMVPDSTAYRLITGWDIGDVNHGGVIMSARETEPISFDAIDELVIKNEKISLAEYVQEFMIKMDYWEKWFRDNGKQPPIWFHWSDASSFQFKSSLEGFEVDEIIKLSQGRIRLMKAPKPKVAVRIRLLKRLLHERRFYVSAQLSHVQDMLRLLKGVGPSKDQIPRTSQYKHAFDAVTYPVMAECPYDIQAKSTPKTEKEDKVIFIPA